jgi:phosphate/sulfate permease
MINVMSNICQYVKMPSKGKVLGVIRKNIIDLYCSKVRHVFMLLVQFSLFTNSLVFYFILVIILCWPVSGHFLKLQSCVFDFARRATCQEA